MTPAQRVHQTAQLICLVCGIGFFLLFFVGLYCFMGIIPPPSPQLTGQELVAQYGGNPVAMRFGIIVSMLGSGLLLPWSGLVAIQIARMERGRRYPLLAITSFGGGVANAVFFILPFVFWSAAFYRMDRNAELIQLINDMSWLEFVMVIPPFCTQVLCIGFAGLSQVEGKPVFPRWFLYLNIWIALLVTPGLIAIFFYTGPFAWNGALAFWMPVVVFTIYLSITFVMFYKAIMSHKDDVA